MLLSRLIAESVKASGYQNLTLIELDAHRAELAAPLFFLPVYYRPIPLLPE